MFENIFAFFVAFICLNEAISSFPYKNRLRADIQRIYGGQQAAPGQFKFQVAFQQSFQFENFTESIHFCSGSILSENWILTSATCVFDDDADNVESSTLANVSLVIGGQQALNKGVIYKIDHIILHPEYKGEETFYEHNIALVKTTQPIKFNDQIQPIELSENDANEGIVAQISGWELESEGLTFTLTFVNMTTITNTVCIKKLDDDFRPMVHKSILCAENVEFSSSSFTDTGSALVNVDDRKLIGILSWVNAFSLDSPEGYTRITSYLDWIANVTETAY